MTNQYLEVIVLFFMGLIFFGWIYYLTWKYPPIDNCDIRKGSGNKLVFKSGETTIEYPAHSDGYSWIYTTNDTSENPDKKPTEIKASNSKENTPSAY